MCRQRTFQPSAGGPFKINVLFALRAPACTISPALCFGTGNEIFRTSPGLNMRRAIVQHIPNRTAALPHVIKFGDLLFLAPANSQPTICECFQQFGEFPPEHRIANQTLQYLGNSLLTKFHHSIQSPKKNEQV